MKTVFECVCRMLSVDSVLREGMVCGEAWRKASSPAVLPRLLSTLAYSDGRINIL